MASGVRALEAGLPLPGRPLPPGLPLQGKPRPPQGRSLSPLRRQGALFLPRAAPRHSAQGRRCAQEPVHGCQGNEESTMNDPPPGPRPLLHLRSWSLWALFWAEGCWQKEERLCLAPQHLRRLGVSTAVVTAPGSPSVQDVIPGAHKTGSCTLSQTSRWHPKPSALPALDIPDGQRQGVLSSGSDHHRCPSQSVCQGTLIQTSLSLSFLIDKMGLITPRPGARAG